MTTRPCTRFLPHPRERDTRRGRAGRINVKDELVVIAANVTTVKVYEHGPLIS